MKIGKEDQTHSCGSYSSQSLDAVVPVLARISDQVAGEFCEFLQKDSDRARVTAYLAPKELAALQQKLAGYVGFLLSADLTADAHISAASRLGRIHGLLGISPRCLIRLFDHLHGTIRDRLALSVHEAKIREAVMDLVSRRIFADIREQLSGYEALQREISAALTQCDSITRNSTNFSDLMHGILGLIGGFEGQISAFFARVDETGELQVEGSVGTEGRRYHHAMMSGEVPRMSIASDTISGLGPGGRAWRSGRIVCSDAWAVEPAIQPWRELGVLLGFRSSAAVPILDDDERTVALLGMYSGLPGFFSGARVHDFLLHLQQSLNQAVQRISQAPVIPLNDRQTYRRLLEDGRLRGYFQPIIDLSNGRLRKLEVLARLVADDGGLLPPGRFLPAFGSDELFRLLAFGLDEAARACKFIAGFDPGVTVAINFPAEGVADPKFADLLLRKIRGHGILPHQIQLEILEERDSGIDDGQRRTFLNRVRTAGIRIAEDDLGSGYSSLRRLDQFGFDDVKIDQALVRSAMHRPERALEFILYLTRLSHSFGAMLTVEGLENFGMVEAAAILGADFGQGFAVARPMPLEALEGWQREFRYTVRPEEPQTAIGALAVYLTWCLQTNHNQSSTSSYDISDLETIMRHFIGRRKIAGTRIDRLVSNHLDGEFSSYDDMKAMIVAEFTELWRSEMAPE